MTTAITATARRLVVHGAPPALVVGGFWAVIVGLLTRGAPADLIDPILRVLPWLIGALRLILGPRPGPTRWLDLESLLLFGVLMVSTRRTLLAPTLLDRHVVVALILVLALYLSRHLPRLLKRLGSVVPVRPAMVFFALPFVVYLALLPWSNDQRPPDGDEPYYLLVTHSLAYDLDADLANNYANEDWRRFLERPIEPQPDDPRGADGAIYSRHNLLLPLILAPFYRLAGLWGALAAMAAMAAATAWMVLRLAHRVSPEKPRGALFAYLLFAFTPPFVLYSQQVWIEVPAALLVTLAVDRLLRGRRRGFRRQDVVVFAGMLALLPLLKLRLALLALPLLALAWRNTHRSADRAAQRTALAAGATVLAVTMAVIFGLNQARFANPLKMHSWHELRVIDHPLSSFASGGFGMFYDVAFGLFACAPLWLLLLPAAWRVARHQRRLGIDLLLIAGPYLLVVAPRFEWYGGWSPPFRYALVTLPLLTLLLIGLLDRPSARTRAIAHGLGAVTLVLAAIWLAVPGWTYNLAGGGTHWLDTAGVRLGADLGRFFPSMVRPRLATWLWPVASLLLVPLALGGRGSVRGGHGASRHPGQAAAWGMAGVLVLLATVTWVAHRIPTHAIELEDGWVQHRGGGIHPPPWTLERPRYRGGWLLTPDGRFSASVVGEGPVILRLATRYVENTLDPEFEVVIAAGDQLLHQFVPDASSTWQVVELGPIDWPRDAPLIVQGPPAKPGRRNGLVVDFADFDWQ